VGKIFVASSAEDDTSYRLRRGLLWKDTGPRRVAVVCVTEQAEPDILGANVHVYCDVNLLLSSGQAVGRCSWKSELLPAVRLPYWLQAEEVATSSVAVLLPHVTSCHIS